MEYKTEQLEKIPNDDWTPLLVDTVKAAIGYTVNVRDHRLERCYTGELKYNRLDHHSCVGLVVEGPGVSFSVEEVIDVNVYFTKGGLMYDIQVDNV